MCRRGPGPENWNRALRGHSGKGLRLYSEERNRLDWHFISPKKRGYSLVVQWLGHQTFTRGSLVRKPRSCKPSGRAKGEKKRQKTATTTKHKSMKTTFSSVQFSRSVVSDSLRSHESQHARPRCPSPTPGVYSNSRPVMPSSHLILCRPLILLPPTPPSIRVFSNESTLHMRWANENNFTL